jgi:DNA polymerase-1
MALTRHQEHLEFQQKQFFPVLRMMNRGLRWDMKRRAELKKELLQIVFDREQQLNWIVGYEINAKSPKQLLNLFYNELGVPGIKALGKETLSTNSPTLQEIASRHPMLAPLCQLITELRSLGVFLSNFIDADVDIDGRMRTSFAVAGPTTYRYASRENAFYSGMNMQNVPVKEKEKIKGSKDYVKLPNIRELALADPGRTFFDLDLDRADMQIVGWESDDAALKTALRKGIDLHCWSASEIFGIKGIPVDELVESHPNYLEHRGRIGKANRDKTKNGGHACDYAVGTPKLAQTLGITRHEADLFKARWYGLFPGIRKWHKRVEQAVAETGYLENIFGARLYQFGRFNLPEFLGWQPQSTVAGVINQALVRIDAAQIAGETSIELLIQVHDSLAGQFETAKKEAEIANLRKYASIVVPYTDPLIIPVGIKTSLKSWGDCK